MGKTDDLFRQFLERLAARNNSSVSAAAQFLTHHEWEEVNERRQFYPELREVLLADPIDPTAIHECVKQHGKTLLGGHVSLRTRVKNFLESDKAADLVRQLVHPGDGPPNADAVDAFIQGATTYGFQDPEGKPKGGDAAYFTSILLTAAFPDDFVECRLTRWKWFAEQFDLSPMPKGSYGVRVCAAASIAKEFVATPTFQADFADERGLWTAGAIAYLLDRNEDLRRLVDGDGKSEPDSVVSLDDATKNAFAQFRKDPSAILSILLRRKRAAQLRDILSDPNSVDLETFNREVWNSQTAARLGGESMDVLKLLNPSAKLEPDKREMLRAGLESGDLELHGNFMWGSGSSVYGPMVPGGDQEKLKFVRQAIDVLEDEDLEPLDKASKIMEIPGFGGNIATGLVMVFHPRKFAIWNSRSTNAISKLGCHPADLAGFQNVVCQIRDELGAEDFLELDWFFYLLDQGLIDVPSEQQAWWVCQGTSYINERRGGYVFAPTETKDGKVFKYHANVALLRPGQSVLHYANGSIQAIGEVQAKPAQTTRPDEMPGEEPGREGHLVRVQYQDLVNPIKLSEIPEEWRTSGEPPFTHKGNVKQGYLFALSRDFMSKFQKKFGDRLPDKEPPPTRPPRIVKIAPGEGARFWQECMKNGYICVGWGEVGDLRQFTSKDEYRTKFGDVFAEGYNNHEATVSRKANELWTLAELRPGDIVVANRGVSHVLAVGEVAEPPYEFRPDPNREEYSHLVHVRWNTSVAKDIPKQGFWALTTVATVPQDLYEFIVGDEPPPEPPEKLTDYVEPSFDEIREAIAAKGIKISDRTLRRYHLSLKTRGFVILCGLSGSGKTWLAELYARAVDAERLLVPVAPNWTTNEDLLGYLNPMDGQYHDTPFSSFLRRAAEHFEDAKAAGVTAKPFHLILDEMNLARVEYYFAKFLSVMEQRARSTDARIELGNRAFVTLPSNLFFVGTVNVDETTHSFADKVYDRAQLVEVTVDRNALASHLGDAPYADALLEIWDAVGEVAPFAFRVLDEVKTYVGEAAGLGISWQEALDEQLIQKVLTKVKGAERRVEEVLEHLVTKTEESFPLANAKARQMLDTLRHHGITSYF